MRTSERERDGGQGGVGRRRAIGRLLAIGALGLATTAFGGGCSLIVDTNDNQCMAASDCDSFAGFRSCNDGVCQAATSRPVCTSDSQCSMYAQATCDVAAGACTRPCSSDSDCGGMGLTCTNGTCGGAATGCTKNADCSGMGSDYICRNSACVTFALTVEGTNLCETIYATKTPPSLAYQDDTAVIFGDILPTANNPDGPYGHLVEDSIKLALDDFSKTDGITGLGSNPNRPLVLVGCNDGVNEDQTDVVAKHLINDLAIPAIVGYAFSGNTITVAQDVTIPDNVLLFSPSATAVAITQLETAGKTKDLLWRDCPNDNVQSQAQLLLFPSVVAAAENRYSMIDTSSIKVAIVNHSDAYGSGLGDAVESGLMFNGMSATAQSGSNYLRVNYGPSTNPDLGSVATITSFAPDIIFLFGFNEAVDQIFTAVEAQWTVPSDGHHPFWMMSDGDEVSSLWQSSTNPVMKADIQSEDERERIVGSVPGTNATSWPAYGTFLTEFSGSTYGMMDGSADTIGPAGAYDILYLLAYSTVMLGDKPITGPNLVKYGLDLINPASGGGTPNQIGPDNIISTLSLLNGDPVNIYGASGPLPFNHQGDLITADIQIWCVPPSGNTPPADVGGAAINSGYYFNSKMNMMAGCLSDVASSTMACNLPDFTKVNCQ